MTNRFTERTKKFEFSPFPYELTVIVSNDINQAVTNRMEKYNLDEPSDDMAACVYNLPNGRCLMFLPEMSDMEYIVHESSHVVWYMLLHAGVGLDKELLAYYTGNLSRKIGEFTWHLKRKKKKRAKMAQTS